MKKKIEEPANTNIGHRKDKMMTRKEAIKKSGLIAVSAATMMMLLSSPNKAHAASPSPPPVWP